MWNFLIFLWENVETLGGDVRLILNEYKEENKIDNEKKSWKLFEIIRSWNNQTHIDIGKTFLRIALS